MSEDLQKVKTLLKVRGCSGRTVTTYISCINRFKNYFEGRDLEDLNEQSPEEQIEINPELYDDNNKFKGIKLTNGEYIYGSILISEPSYMEKFNKVQIKQRIIRRICFMNHPIPGIGEIDSCQIIIPQNQIGRNYDIYILQLGYGHCACKKGYYVIIISTFDDKNDINKVLPIYEYFAATFIEGNSYK